MVFNNLNAGIACYDNILRAELKDIVYKVIIKLWNEINLFGYKLANKTTSD